MSHERTLIYVPILHTAHDMGTLAPSMREAYVKKFGEAKWREHGEAIDEMWGGIRKSIEGLHLPFHRLKVYQDGLPICGREREVVSELAAQGSPNHRLVLWIVDRGATLVGTEDPKLLLAEYRHVKDIAEARTHREREQRIQAFQKEEAPLLRRRDEKIRDRILETLEPKETGVLFIGLLHHVDELLPGEIDVRYLIHRLPFRRSFELSKVA